MRSRSLKPGLFKNEKLGSADPLLTILFEGLWCMSDREGRMEDRPLRICAEVFPYRRVVTEKKVDTMLEWLRSSGFIARYEVGGKRFIQVLKFLSHQNPHKHERPSEIPALTSIPHPTSTGQAPCDDGKCTDLARLTPDSGLLTPDSSLRERARARRLAPDKTGLEAHALTERLKATYPPGTYRASNWILAEREISKMLDGGEDPDAIEIRTREFRAQQDAKGSTGTQFVLSPEKFFGAEGHWRGPFPLPQSSSPKGAGLSMDELRAKYPEAASG